MTTINLFKNLSGVIVLVACVTVLKVLKGKEVLTVDVVYRDATLSSRTAELTVYYGDLPVKEAQINEQALLFTTLQKIKSRVHDEQAVLTKVHKKIKSRVNDEHALLVTAHQQIRCRVVVGVCAAAASVGRLDRSSAVEHLRTTVDDLRNIQDTIMDDLGEEARLDLTEWLEAAVANVDYCSRFVRDLAVRWDDAWGRLKALESSVSREVPTSAAVYVPGSELYPAPNMMKDRMVEISSMLKDMYLARGLETEVLEQYQNVVEELEEKIMDEEDTSYP